MHKIKTILVAMLMGFGVLLALPSQANWFTKHFHVHRHHHRRRNCRRVVTRRVCHVNRFGHRRCRRERHVIRRC